MTAGPAESCRAGDGRKIEIAFFGHFGQGNFGNETTLQAVLHNLRRLAPNAEFTCVCTGPNAVAATYGIAAVPSRLFLARRWVPRNALARWVRRLLVVALGEPYQWLNSLRTLRGKNALVVPGSGILQDADTLLGWGPYDMFRWAVSAKLCRCKLLFVSVGAGPLYSRAGRFFVKTALSLADFRSYRDESTRQCLEGFWPPAGRDPVYPDLAFSLPESLTEADRGGIMQRPVVGLGLMKGPLGRYSEERPTGGGYANYLEALLEFARWLLTHGYDIRLLFGDVTDAAVTAEFRTLLDGRAVTPGAGRVIDEPIESVDDLLRQLAETDLVVATRFHNVLLALLLGKPVIAITFHHKCTSLMSQMGLSEYCQDIKRLGSDGLIEQFLRLVQSADVLQGMIREGVESCRDALAGQYALVFGEICSGRRRMPRSTAKT